MPPRKSYFRKNTNVEKQTPMDPTDPLGENVTHVEFRVSIQVIA